MPISTFIRIQIQIILLPQQIQIQIQIQILGPLHILNIYNASLIQSALQKKNPKRTH